MSSTILVIALLCCLFSLYNASSYFLGTYSDPNHPDCFRLISEYENGTTIVTGADNANGDGYSCSGISRSEVDFWGPLFATISDDTSISVDFSPKGGPSDLAGTYDTTTNIINWSDGNTWTKNV